MSKKLSRWILKSFCYYLLYIWNYFFFKLKDCLIDEISYFWKLEDDCNTHKKIFLIVLSILMMFLEKKRWVCKYLALSTSVEENKNSVKLDFMSFWRLTKIQFHNYFLNSGRVFWHNTTPFILSLGSKR